MHCLAAALLACAAAACAADVTTSLRDEAQRYERGDGVPRDEAQAAALYCRAAKAGDAEAQYHLGWMYAYARGVPRQDGWAAYLLNAAAEQGVPQAPNLLKLIGSPAPEQPECLRDPPPPRAARDDDPGLPPGVIPEPLRASAPKAIMDLVAKMAPEYRIEPRLALAIIRAESNFDPQAVSPKNAQGLMQLIPETAARFAVRNAADPKQNIRGGLAYLRWLLAYFQGDVRLVAAAYNAGERTVERYQGVPPYGETKAYVQRILSWVGGATHPFDPSVTQPSPRLPQMQR